MSTRRRIAFAHKARQDLQNIGTQGDQFWGRERTRAYLRAIYDAALRLPDFPELHPALGNSAPGFRKARSGAHLLIYRSDGARIVIVRVLHERMDVDSQELD
jgi:toxin ParE1/3/4